MTKLSRKERMQKAEEMAGISFWVDLRKGRLSKYTIQKHVRSFFVSLFRYVILICLGFVVITPLWNLVRDAFTAPAVLGEKSSSWIPQQVSTIFMSMSISKNLMDYWPSLLYTLLTTVVLTFLQVLSTGLAAYSFARLKFKGSNILFFFVVLTIVVPSDSIMLAQYAAFRNFDIFGLIGLINGTGAGINLINGSPVYSCGNRHGCQERSVYLLPAPGCQGSAYFRGRGCPCGRRRIPEDILQHSGSQYVRFYPDGIGSELPLELYRYLLYGAAES